MSDMPGRHARSTEATADSADTPDTGEADRRVLRHLVWCPLIAPGALQAVLGYRSPTGLAARLASLAAAGLAADIPYPQARGRAPHLWYATDAGLARVAADAGVAPRDLAMAAHCRGVDLLHLCRRLPEVHALYALLALVAGVAHADPGGGALTAWQRPWTLPAPAGSPDTVPLRLPALVTFRTPTRSVSACLLADLGHVSPRAWYGQARRFLAWRQARGLRGGPRLLLAVPEDWRGREWVRYLRAAHGACPGPLPLEQLVYLQPLGSTVPLKSGPEVFSPGADDWSDAARPPTAPPLPRRPPLAGGRAIVGTRLRRDAAAGLPPSGAAAGRLAWTLGPLDWAVLAALAAHPWLPPQRLAVLLGSSLRAIRERLHALQDRGLLRLATDLEGDDVQRAAAELAALPGAALRPAAGWLELFEATTAGLDAVVAWSALPADLGSGWLGLVGNGPEAPQGGRLGLAKDLAHTVGVDAIMVALHAAAVAHGAASGLMRWRNATASGRGTMRPDAAGVVDVGAPTWFWLEFERGRAESRTLAAKFGTYRDHVARGEHLWDVPYEPSLLLVVTTGGATTEARIRGVVRAGRAVDTPERLTVLTTTTERMLAPGATMLGRIWRVTDQDDAAADVAPFGVV